MPVKQTFTDIPLALSGSRLQSTPLVIPPGYRSIDIKIISSVPAWGTLSPGDALTWGLEWLDGATWRFLLGNDASQTVRARAMSHRQVDKAGQPPSMGGGPFPFIDGGQVRIYGRTTVASLALTVRVSIQ